MRKQMMSVLFMLLLGGMVFSAGITVVSPNGGEELVLGTSHVIRWDAEGTKYAFKVTLWDGSKLVGTLKSSKNAGNGRRNFNWKVGVLEDGKVVPVGKNYLVKIKEKGTAITDTSDRAFTIKESNLPKIDPNFNKPGTTIVQLDPKYRPKREFLDLELGCKLEADKTTVDRLNFVKLKVSFKNASTHVLVRKNADGNHNAIAVPGITFPTFAGEVKDEPVMNCEYVLTVTDKTGKSCSSSVKVNVVQEFKIYEFKCSKEAKYGDKFQILMNFRGASSASLTDQKGKNYPLGFSGEYVFIKALNPEFEYPATFKLTIKNSAGKELSGYCEIKEKRTVYPR